MSNNRGWKLCFVAGLFPFTIGIYGYMTGFLVSTVFRPEEPFLVLWKESSLSMGDLMRFNHEAGIFMGIANLCFWQMATLFGGTISTLSYFGIRRGERWTWFFRCAALLWGAGNDTCAAVYLYTNDVMVVPTPLFVDLLGLTGLYLSRDVARIHRSKRS